MKKLNIFLLAFLFILNSALAEKIKVGTSPDYPPFEFMKDNEITGFEVELTNELAKRVGVEIEWLSMPFSGIIAALKSGKIEAAATGMVMTPERHKILDFSTSFYSADNAYLKQKDREDIKEISDLAGKKVGFQMGTTREIAVKNIKDAIGVGMEETMTMVMSTSTGKLDAFVIEKIVGKKYAKEHPNLVVFATEKDWTEGIAMAFVKGSKYMPKFDAALKEFMQTDEYKKLKEKYELD